MNDLVSIIVPVYNAEQYLNCCIDSVLNQTCDSKEIILSDDGGTDDGARISDEYASRNDNIVIIHKQNGGVSSARNAGINAACGRWITFCDSDDWLEQDAVQTLVTHAKKDDVLIVGDIEIRFHDRDGNVTKVRRNEKNEYGEFSAENGFAGFETAFKRANYSSACAKLYSTEVIRANRLAFREDRKMLEDMEFVFRYLCHVSVIVNDPRRIYIYRAFDYMDYMAKRQQADLLDDICAAYDAVDAFSDTAHIDDKSYFSSFFLWQIVMNIRMLWDNPEMPFGEKKQRMVRCARFIKENQILNEHNIEGLSRAERSFIKSESVLRFNVFNTLKKIRSRIIR